MKTRITTSTALLLLSVLALATACGGGAAVRSYNDPFEGPTRGYVLYLDRGHLTAIAGREIAGRHELELLFVDRGQHEAVVPAGTLVELMVGGRNLQFVTSNDATPVSNVFGYTVITQWKLVVQLDDEQAAHLARAPLSAIRATIGGQPYVLQLSEGQAQIVQRNTLTLLTGEAT